MAGEGLYLSCAYEQAKKKNKSKMIISHALSMQFRSGYFSMQLVKFAVSSADIPVSVFSEYINPVQLEEERIGEGLNGCLLTT